MSRPRKPRTIFAVRTGRGGLVTSFREAWRAWGDRPVYTWRCDKDQPPHDFGSRDAAWAFIVSIWCCASTRREREERDSWVIEEIAA